MHAFRILKNSGQEHYIVIAESMAKVAEKYPEALEINVFERDIEVIN